MSLHVQRCRGCGEHLFPRRLLCPGCGHQDFADVHVERGRVVASTQTADGTTLLTVVCEGDLHVVARLVGAPEDLPLQRELPLTTSPTAPGPAAYVPDPTHAGADDGDDPRRLPRDTPLRECTVPGMLVARAALTPEAPLLVCGDVRRTAAEMVEAVARAAGALSARGVAAGDRVAFLVSNRVELLDVVLGSAWLGAVAVPINTAARGTQLHHILANSQARLLVVEADIETHLDDLPPLPDLEARWVLGEQTEPMGEPVPPAAAAPGDPAAILYTSGTTGVSKGVICPHAQFWWWGNNVSDQIGIQPDDVLHTCLPLFHTNALNAFSQAVVSGATYVLGGRFSASRFWTQMAESGATVTYLLGAMVGILDSQPPSDRDRAHRVRLALSPATPGRLLRPFRDRFGVALLDGYGSTETNAVVATRLGEERPGYVGTLQPGFRMRVVDADGADVPPGTPGELLLRSDQPFAFASGYFRMPEATAAAWQDLWFHSGDRVCVEPDGSIRFVDRIKDVIRRRGENISSLEVEDVLRAHPAIAEVAVYAVDSELGEDEVMAAVVVKDGADLDFEELVTFCGPRLAAYAIPRFLVRLDALPLTENGKVRKPELRSRGTDGAWDRQPPRPTAPHSAPTERTSHA
ncbi:ATP-dependent acyl-CoA ligase [Nocardioides sp. QY071]|uniref:ATP-dependent acyl-CoA ligase n=1 Tax=Nocardioides sp. QY071 TaxID=3044187 RepID=UPI00249C239C|nr:ATP-dependent acyl-CoA ligase [Nocardioides sp. QY071]WGY02922.1 ATP-dependent acyl-CoA ligase [Nocardioides sp. QY071]